jgi:hypothetical protein
LEPSGGGGTLNHDSQGGELRPQLDARLQRDSRLSLAETARLLPITGPRDVAYADFGFGSERVGFFLGLSEP